MGDDSHARDVFDRVESPEVSQIGRVVGESAAVDKVGDFGPLAVGRGFIRISDRGVLQRITTPAVRVLRGLAAVVPPEGDSVDGVSRVEGDPGKTLGRVVDPTVAVAIDAVTEVINLVDRMAQQQVLGEGRCSVALQGQIVGHVVGAARFDQCNFRHRIGARLMNFDGQHVDAA